MIPKKYKILEIINESHDTKSFKIDYKGKYNPGQFFEIGLLGIGEAPISVASNSKKYVEFTIRNVGNVTNNLHKLKKGNYVWLRGPFGHGYPMKELIGNSIVLVGGGCGVAPMAGALEYVANNRKKYKDVKLFFGFKSVDEVLYKKRLPNWKKHFELNISLDSPDKKWKGFVGFVTDLLKKHDINPKSYALVCGPSVMIKFVVDILKNKGVKEKRILLSLERKMHCGLGKCGHCRINDKYVCKDGPVFRYTEVKTMYD